MEKGLSSASFSQVDIAKAAELRTRRAWPWSQFIGDACERGTAVLRCRWRAMVMVNAEERRSGFADQALLRRSTIISKETWAAQSAAEMALVTGAVGPRSANRCASGEIRDRKHEMLA